ncbi:RNA polymerase sigma factor [Nocardioides sp. CPCC 206347]|uniref:RNA polymerase sigma factor n=2 Tax=Nocardioides TaxID=1839 RepID=UPI003B43BDFB
MPDAVTTEAVTEVWRKESAVLIAALTRMTRDVGMAEDLAQDAFVTALEQWPASGIPDNPAAWLMTTAKRRAIDSFRRAETLRRKTAELERTAGEVDPMPDLTSQVDHIEDDVLRLMFLCCHPTLTADSRAALTLRMVGGLTTVEIARGFLVADATMGQRIARAKKTLADAKAGFDLPTGADRVRRLDDVMAVIYLVFNEGYAATAGEDWTRPDLATEGIRLARMLAGLAPDEPEAHGLQALLELQASRLHARTDAAGNPLLLDDQDRDRWDRLLIRRGVAALGRAEALAARGVPVGRYFLQARIAHEHARTTMPGETNWPRIAALYDLLREAAPGPVVEVNRAVAHGRAFGAAAGIAVLDAVPADALGSSPLIPSVRGDLLSRSGEHSGAAEQFDEAARRTRNDAERLLLQGRASRSRSAQ